MLLLEQATILFLSGIYFTFYILFYFKEKLGNFRRNLYRDIMQIRIN